MLETTATKLPRLMACNGSRLMSPAFPNMDDDRTLRDEGDAAHWLAKAVFDGTHTLNEMGERKAPNGVHITTDMCDHVGEYLSALVCGEMETDTSFSGNGWAVNARADHMAYDAPTSTLYVDDFKYGWSIVEPDWNWTLIAHAIGYCIRRGITPATIVLRIHQPRPHHRLGKLREWRISYDVLMQAYAQLDATLSNPSDALVTGDHCRRCWALVPCPAARKANLNAVDTSERSAFSDAVSDDLLAFELDTLRTAMVRIKQGLDAREELAEYRIKNGAIVPNYHMEQQFGNRVFIPGIDALTLTVLTGADMSKAGTVTPSEGERRLVAIGKTKKEAEALLKPFTQRASIGAKIVREDTTKRAQRLLNAKEQ